MEKMILDSISINGRRDKNPIRGIIDFKNKKFIHFFDFTNDFDEDLMILAVIWRITRPDLRFSVFCSIYFPKKALPKVKVISRYHVEVVPKESPSHKKIKKTRFAVKTN